MKTQVAIFCNRTVTVTDNRSSTGVREKGPGRTFARMQPDGTWRCDRCHNTIKVIS